MRLDMLENSSLDSKDRLDTVGEGTHMPTRYSLIISGPLTREYKKGRRDPDQTQGLCFLL